MRPTAIILLVTAIILGVSFVNAGADSKEAFYRESVDQKIDQCMHKARFIDSKGEHLKLYGEKASRQAKFYQEQKETLVRKMIEDNIDENPHAVSYFLIKAYYDSTKRTLTAR